MRKRYLVLGLSVFIALAVAVPAIGDSGPTASTAASSKKALKKAKKALKKAKQAQNAADDAQSTADGAQTAADNAQTAADTAQQAADAALAQNVAIDYEQNTNSATFTTIFDQGGLRLQARCQGATRDITVRATTTKDGVMFAAANFAANAVLTESSDDFDVGETITLDADIQANGTINYNAPDGTQIAISYTSDDVLIRTPPTAGCLFGGNANILTAA